MVQILQDNGNMITDTFDGADVLEERLKGIPEAPRVLHLATHGFFCEDLHPEPNRILENPLLRSGLALAGANRRTSPEEFQTEDGILTAFEVSGLKLVGTALAVLSACETGVGEVRNGGGGYGLRRAFQQAGAESIIMSLWKVPDKETYELMEHFYSNWIDGQSKQMALRQAVLEVMDDLKSTYGVAHPRLWGGFVLVGNPS